MSDTRSDSIAHLIDRISALEARQSALEAVLRQKDEQIASLSTTITTLEAKDAARHAMYRYWRVLDYKQFDQLTDCFTENADCDWGTAGWQAIGRQQIYDFLHTNESADQIRLSHFGHNDEITVLDDRTVRGIFKLEDWVTHSGRTIMRGFGQYNMLFEKGDDGVYRISRLRLQYDYREETRYFIDGRMLSSTPALDT